MHASVYTHHNVTGNVENIPQCQGGSQLQPLLQLTL